MKYLPLVLLSLACLLVAVLAAEQCGSQAGGALCADNLCCSEHGYCGDTPAYCGEKCQSQCQPGGTPTPTPSGGSISSLIPESLFNEMLKHQSDPNCQGGFYTYATFIEAAASFGDFGTVGDETTRKGEIAAFLAQTSHETTGGWSSAPDGPYAWGYCFFEEQIDRDTHCRPDEQWPCAPHKKYFGRGPIQLSWNYNYGQVGRIIGSNLLANPDLVTSNPTIAFKTALWFWMTPQSPKPSSHDVITGRWTPSADDTAAGRVTGFGLITNIINGGKECGKGANDQVADRIGFYTRYCSLLGITPGNNLDCYSQTHYPD